MRLRKTLQTVTITYACLEVAWFVWQQWRYSICNLPSKLLPDEEEIRTAQGRFLALKDALCIRSFLRGWFHDAPFERILRGNVEEFVAHGWHCKGMEDMHEKEAQDVRNFVSAMEAKWCIRFQPGHNPHIDFMNHIYEPLRTLPMPLVVYLFSEGWGLVLRVLLHMMGFQRGEEQGISYWVRYPDKFPGAHVSVLYEAKQNHSVRMRDDSSMNLGELDPAEETNSPSAILFLHGVGLGLLPYMRFVRMIASEAPMHPILLLEFRPICLRFSWRAVPIDEVAHLLAGVIRRRGLGRVCVVGHSFGTLVATRFYKLHPLLVQSMVLLDPVCLMTCSPHLLRAFIYEIPKLWHFISFLGWMNLGRYLVSRELIISETFCRQFCWHQLMLWPTDMPELTVLMLSTCDPLVPSKLVKATLEAANSEATLLVHPSAGHGGFLIDTAWQLRLAAAVGQIASNTRALPVMTPPVQ